MDSQQKIELIESLTLILIPVLFMIFAMIGIWIFVYFKGKNQNNKDYQENLSERPSSKAKSVNKESIFKFMEENSNG